MTTLLTILELTLTSPLYLGCGLLPNNPIAARWERTLQGLLGR